MGLGNPHVMATHWWRFCDCFCSSSHSTKYRTTHCSGTALETSVSCALSVYIIINMFMRTISQERRLVCVARKSSKLDLRNSVRKLKLLAPATAKPFAGHVSRQAKPFRQQPSRRGRTSARPPQTPK